MPDVDDASLESDPPALDPYEVLGLDRSASADQVRSAYRKAALKNHPDKVPDHDKAVAHGRFQAIALAYTVLSDPARRKRYDATGSTAESIVDSDGFNWSDFYRDQYKYSMSADAIEEFAEKYKGSDEEKYDLLVAFVDCEGDLDQVYQRVMLSSVVQDDARFRRIIDEAIESDDVPTFATYTHEAKRKRAARLKAAKAEAGEAEDYAKELGVHGKLFGNKKGSKSRAGSEDNLAALIQKRQQDRSADFLHRLADKYGASGPKGIKGKKRQLDKEPSEEAFQAAAAKLNKRCAGGAKSGFKSKSSRE